MTIHLDKSLRTLAYILIGVALLAFIGYFIIYNIYAFHLFRFPFDYDQGEGYELLDTLLLSRGESPYRNADTYPFYSSNYPPIFHVAIIPLVWLFGPQYWTGRLMSYLGTLITAAAIGYAVQRQTKRWWLATISGLIYLASNYIYHVGPLFRQHLFMVMFETLAVVLLTVTYEREEATGRPWRRGLLGVMVLLILAGYTKQLAYASVLAVFLFMLLRNWKRPFIWGVPFTAVVGLIFLGINWATGGQWWINTISANLNDFMQEQAIGLYRQWFTLHTVITLLSAAYAFYQLYFERLSAYTIWFVIAVLNSVTAGTWGAGPSYFATAIAASCILSGLAIGHTLDWSATRTWERSYVTPQTLLLLAVPMLYLMQADSVFHMPTHTPLLRATAQILGKPTETLVAPQTSCSEPRPPEPIPYVDEIFTLLGNPPKAADTAAGQAIAQYIIASDTPAFSEEAGFNFYAGQDIVTNPTQLRNLDLAGLLDKTEMITMINNQEFDTVIFRAQFFPPDVLQAIGQAYEPHDLIQMNGFVYCILTPRE